MGNGLGRGSRASVPCWQGTAPMKEEACSPHAEATERKQALTSNLQLLSSTPPSILIPLDLIISSVTTGSFPVLHSVILRDEKAWRNQPARDGCI